MRRAVVIVCVAMGCAGARPAAVQGVAMVEVTPDEAALTALVDAAREGPRSNELLRQWSVPRHDAGSARALTGEPAVDDGADAVRVVTRVGGSAVVLATTRCGNAALVGLAWRDARWEHRATHALADDARPGRCRLTQVTADARPMLSADAREVIATVRSRSEDGDDAPDPVLQLVHVGDDGALAVWARDVPFGREDDASGAVTDAEWIVEEALLLPRDLYVELRPGRAGPGGRAPRELVRRTYRVVDGHLTLVDESLAPWRDAPDAGAANRGP